MPTARKTARDPYRMRKCKHCKLPFKPTTKNAKNADEQQFCTPAHRKEFWKYGSLPVEKLFGKFEKRVREIAREEMEAALVREIAQEEIGAALMKMQLDPNWMRLKPQAHPSPSASSI